MPTYFQRPENALKRANEFIDVGKPIRALDALCDVIKSKKHRTWQKIHEPIMEKYLELCVSLKKSHVAKEGLHQYKNICQQVNVASLEKVVRLYLQLAEGKTEEASKQSHQAVIDIDDLECPQTPESLLLSAVSAEDTQDRADRAILTPWVKFLWESYRQCLDLLRNNSSYEKLYQDIAQQAFAFCIKYERKTEFRKLCESLRLHLGHIQKHHNQQRAINLSNPESQALHLETRLVQLDSAITMELWAEALKAVEDVHGLVSLSKKPPKPSLMANYYSKVALVFWKSGSYLFHAAAWHALYRLSRDQRKNLSQEELQKLASRVLVATLAVPVVPQQSPLAHVLDVEDTTTEKQRRLATLLGLNAPPTRASLIAELLKGGAVQHAHPQLQPLYLHLEVEFHPLTLAERVKSSLEYCKEQEALAPYIEPLNVVTVTRLITQVAQVYDTISLERFTKLAPFMEKQRLARITVNVAKNLELPLRIDHRTKSITFTADGACCTGGRMSDDLTLGPVLQALPGEQLRSQLVNMANILQKAVSSLQDEDNIEALRQKIASDYKRHARAEHEKILERKLQIESRKVRQEEEQSARQQEVYERQEEERRKQKEIENDRLIREMEERERKKRQQEHDEIKKRETKARIDQMRATEIGRRVFEGMDEDEIEQLDPDTIMARQVEQLEKEKKELTERLKTQEKKVDHFERAKRLEEIPLLEKFSEKMTEEAKNYWELQEHNRIDELRRERVLAMQHRDRLRRMLQDKENWMKELKKDRFSVYKEKIGRWEMEMKDVRVERLAARREQRKRERREDFYTKKKEEEERRKMEDERKKKEESEKIEQEKKDQEKREYDEKLKKLQEMENKKREKEKEIELREQQKKASLDRHNDGAKNEDRWRDSSSSSGVWRPKTTSNWRDKEIRNKESWRGGSSKEESVWRRNAEQSPATSAPRERDSRSSGNPWRMEGKEESRGGAWRPEGKEESRGTAWRPEGKEESRGGAWRPEGKEESRGGAWRSEGKEESRGGAWRPEGREESRGGAWRPEGKEESRGGAWRTESKDEPRGGAWRTDSRDEPRGGGAWRTESKDESRGGGAWRTESKDESRGSSGYTPRRENRDRDWRSGPPSRDFDREKPAENKWRTNDPSSWRKGEDRKDGQTSANWRMGSRDDRKREDRDDTRKPQADDDGWRQVRR